MTATTAAPEAGVTSGFGSPPKVKFPNEGEVMADVTEVVFGEEYAGGNRLLDASDTVEADVVADSLLVSTAVVASVLSFSFFSFSFSTSFSFSVSFCASSLVFTSRLGVAVAKGVGRLKNEATEVAEVSVEALNEIVAGSVTTGVLGFSAVGSCSNMERRFSARRFSFSRSLSNFSIDDMVGFRFSLSIAKSFPEAKRIKRRVLTRFNFNV